MMFLIQVLRRAALKRVGLSGDLQMIAASQKKHKTIQNKAKKGGVKKIIEHLNLSKPRNFFGRKKIIHGVLDKLFDVLILKCTLLAFQKIVKFFCNFLTRKHLGGWTTRLPWE